MAEVLFYLHKVFLSLIIEIIRPKQDRSGQREGLLPARPQLPVCGVRQPAHYPSCLLGTPASALAVHLGLGNTQEHQPSHFLPPAFFAVEAPQSVCWKDLKGKGLKVAFTK